MSLLKCLAIITDSIRQLGGLFIYSEKNGFIYQHASKYAGDYANYEE